MCKTTGLLWAFEHLDIELTVSIFFEAPINPHILYQFNLIIKFCMNSIIAYTLGMVVNFRNVANSLLFGLEKYVGDYYGALLTFANFMILFLILNYMYKMRVFVKI